MCLLWMIYLNNETNKENTFYDYIDAGVFL